MAPVPPTGRLGPGLSLAVWNPSALWEIGAIEALGGRHATPKTMHVALFSESMPAALAMAYFSRMGNESRRATLDMRSEEHTSELQSLMRISYAVFCLNKKKQKTYRNT